MRKQGYPTKLRDYAQVQCNGGIDKTPDQRSELILHYTPLIKYIAARLAARLPSHISVDDLISCGIIGLIDAIDKFDPHKNVQFKTYAEFRIRGAMLDELRSLDWVPRSVRRKITTLEKAYGDCEKRLGRPADDDEVAAALGLDMEDFHRLLDETKSVTFLDIEILRQSQSGSGPEGGDVEVAEPTGGDPFAAVNMSQLRELVAQAIDELPDKERLTVALYYFEELTMKEIGQILGYTESRISQMHSKAMLRLRTKLRRRLGA
ncbi:MAG: FliA/WhiG family RNA polymerase sigma factor [Thermodesulfobacteriota bacterium]